MQKPKRPGTYLGSSTKLGKNREVFGQAVVDVLEPLTVEQRKARVLVIDSDLEGSTGLKDIRKEYPEIFFNGGVMERDNYSAAAGFGFDKGKQGIFATFSAFSEMILSEATMARLNDANVLCHFSHAGVERDGRQHLPLRHQHHVRRQRSAGRRQDAALLPRRPASVQGGGRDHLVRSGPALRLLDALRHALHPQGRRQQVLRPANGYVFKPGKDEVIREGSAGYVVSYGEMLYRALDAVERARAMGIDVGLINKPTLNVVDEDMMKKVGQAPFVLVVETQNLTTGLGARYGTWLLERGLSPKLCVMATTKPGHGGLAEHVPWQGLDPDSILAKARGLAG